jgi:outer membrane biosynthesis protein TonB
MPSPRSILNDIHDLKLDPKKVHTAMTKSGRLSTNSSKAEKEPVEKPGLVFLSSNEEAKDLTTEMENVEATVETVEQIVQPEVSKVEEKDVKKNYTMSEKQKKKQQYQKKNSHNN